MKKLKQRVLAGLLSLVMGVGAVNVPVLAHENALTTDVSNEMVTLTEKGAITEETVSGNCVESLEEVSDEKQEYTTDEKRYEGENYNVTFSLTSSWESGYNANIKVENTGKETIQNWYVSLDYIDEITNIWNAEIYTHENNHYMIKNAGWNQDIVAGGV